MNRPTPTACLRTDAVLALYLDGDVGAGERPDHSLEGSGFELVCGESLRDHLLGCATCRTQLQRARRLDAVLAAHAGCDVGSRGLDDLATRWFGALAAEAPRPVSTAPARPRAAAAAVVVLFAALAGGLALFAWRPAPAAVPTPLPAAPIGPPPPAPAPVTPPPPAAGTILIADDAPQRRARQRTAVPAPAPGRADLAQLLEDPTRSTSERLDALARLAGAAREGRSDHVAALRELLLTLAGLGDRDVALHQRALERIRGDAPLLGAVQTQLQRLETQRGQVERVDLAVVTVAARVGERPLDAALQRVVRRHPELAPVLAAALRAPVRTTGRAALLLDVWQDLDARGDLGADAAGPRRWFQAQPTDVFDELEQERQTTGSAPRRVQCLLALGEGTDPASLATLLDQLQRAPFFEAHAAAFALSHRPRRELEPLVPAARAVDQFLLRAALARAALPAATPWIDALALDDDDRQALAAGRFDDFPRVASWFRDRSQTRGD